MVRRVPPRLLVRFVRTPRPPKSPLFPYTTLFRSAWQTLTPHARCPFPPPIAAARAEARFPRDGDRKSTRLNSSHANISYAVFCLKKKTTRAEKAAHDSSLGAERQPPVDAFAALLQ